uniref:NADH dehydrogenase subunit 6 n=1 Tax=Haemadipsa yanyuanensis TaxID=2870508 RepID=UPI0023D7B9A5|nr:NADH dehydrogenase subunit 6 [Haemadipsa yanyuanensis]WDA96161.1 NADH dehydrogenase subunit 6 [Haemadipsa yanyuanensis]
MFLIFGVSMNLFIISSPVMMLLMILFNSLLLSMIIAFNLSSWYAFLMFLIYIGGMLVMFSYFVAISPNQYIKMKLMLFSPVLIMLMLLLNSYIYGSTMSMNNLFFNFILMMYKNESNFCTLFLILLLMLMMLMVSKLMKLSKGPLRPFMYVYTITKS